CSKASSCPRSRSSRSARTAEVTGRHRVQRECAEHRRLTPMARRATKIVATLGPASSEPQLLEQMIRAGVNVVRLDLSHGKAQDHIDLANLVREAAQRAGREVAIMADLQGPKIRVGKFEEGKVALQAGAKFVL